jgi:hypothetical protein
MAKPVDITGQRFGRLIAIQWTGNKDKVGSYLWHCQCDCGNTQIASAGRLRHGAVKSCRCNQRTGLTRYRHGYRHKQIYHIWCGIIQRCTNPNNKAYKYYGGRGIKICDHWKDFANFIADITAEIGDRPDDLSLDRINNNGNYEPGNIRWATRSEQMLNKRPYKEWNVRKRARIDQFSVAELKGELARRQKRKR